MVECLPTHCTPPFRKFALKSLEIARRQSQLGAISYLGLLTTQTTYQTALIALVQAQAARYADTAALFQALGGGWWNREDVATAKKWDLWRAFLIFIPLCAKG
jgi:outer membrane protein TolC